MEYIRVNISIRKDIYEEYLKFAERTGRTFSGLVVYAIRKLIGGDK